MALPTSYMTVTKNLGPILIAIQGAKAPSKFTMSFLESLGFKNKTDRTIIGVLKALGFLSDGGEPISRYYEFLDQTQGRRVLAEAVEEAFSDLFQVNKEAQKLTLPEVKNKLKTLTQGQYSENVINWMASTFLTLASQADFTAVRPNAGAAKTRQSETVNRPTREPEANVVERRAPLQSLQYVINIQLPESRDPAVYDALFRSMREHLAIE
jgi:hypothetical protein